MKEGMRVIMSTNFAYEGTNPDGTRTGWRILR
jgi:hypothetical protein